MLFFLDTTTTREVMLGRLTTSPTAAWTVQVARNVFPIRGDKLANARALVVRCAHTATGR